MRTINAWFDEYNQSHQNMTNKYIHWLCVPTILFTIIGLLMAINEIFAAVIIALTVVFYFVLDKMLAVAMMILMIAMWLFVHYTSFGVPVYVAIFVVAWIGQFIGHKIEGKKPSFFTDLQFLLIGPLWCMDAWFGSLFKRSKNPANPAYVA